MADPTSFEWQIMDDQGLTNRTQMFIAYNGATETVDALIGEWALLGNLIDECIDGQIVGGQILIPLIADAGFKTAPVVGNNANQVMTLGFDNDFNSYLTPINLPTYKESQLNTASPRAPNLAATALAALIAAVITDTGTAFVNSRDLHDLIALNKAFLTTRKLKGSRAKTTSRPG